MVFTVMKRSNARQDLIRTPMRTTTPPSTRTAIPRLSPRLKTLRRTDTRSAPVPHHPPSMKVKTPAIMPRCLRPP